MIDFKDFDENNLASYSLEDLYGFVNQIEMKVSVLNTECASEMEPYLKNEKFDIYSRSGEKKIQNIAKKYAIPLAGAREFLKIIGAEIAKKEQYEEEMRYSGKSSMPRKQESKEEFLRKEQDKTWAYKSKIE